MDRTRQDGFTLVELMITIAVIAIIAAFAVQHLHAARMATNEASAINTLRNITTANNQYRVRFGTFADDLDDLSTAEYIDTVIGTPPFEKAGYGFAYTVVNPLSSWQVEAMPLDYGATGYRGFYIDASGVIRFTLDGSAPDDSATPVD